MTPVIIPGRIQRSQQVTHLALDLIRWPGAGSLLPPVDSPFLMGKDYLRVRTYQSGTEASTYQEDVFLNRVYHWMKNEHWINTWR